MGCITMTQIRGTWLLTDIIRTLGSVKGVKDLLSELLSSSPNPSGTCILLPSKYICDLSLTVILCHPKVLNETCEAGRPLLSVGTLTVGGILRHRIDIERTNSC